MMQETRSSWSRNLVWFARGSGICLAVSLLGQALQFGTTVLLTRTLGPAAFGLYAAGMSVVKLLGQLALLGMHSAMVRFIPALQQSSRRPAVRNTVGAGLLVSGLASLLASVGLLAAARLFASRVLHEPDLTPVLRTLSIGLPGVVVLHLAAHTCRGMGWMRRFAVFEYVGWQVPFLLLATISLAAGFELAGILSSFVLAAGGAAAWAWLGLCRCLPKAHGISAERLRVGVLVRFGVPVMLAGLGALAVTTSDRLILMRFWDSSFVGVYDTAARLATKLLVVLVAISSAFAPLIARLHEEGDTAGLRRGVQIAARWATGLSLPAFLILLLYPEVVLSLFGTSYVKGAPVLKVLAVSQMISVSVGPVGYALVMTGRHRLEALNTGFLVITNLLLNILLIPRNGLFGAAVATGISIALVNLLRLIEVRVCHGVWALGRGMTRIAYAGTIAAALSLMTREATRAIVSPTLADVLGVAVCTLVYVAVAYAIAIKEEDWEAFRGLVGRGSARFT